MSWLRVWDLEDLEGLVEEVVVEVVMGGGSMSIFVDILVFPVVVVVVDGSRLRTRRFAVVV